MRSCSGAHRPVGRRRDDRAGAQRLDVVGAGGRHDAHSPAKANGAPSARVIQGGVAVARPLVEAVGDDQAAPARERVAERGPLGDGLGARVDRLDAELPGPRPSTARGPSAAASPSGAASSRGRRRPATSSPGATLKRCRTSSDSPTAKRARSCDGVGVGQRVAPAHGRAPARRRAFALRLGLLRRPTRASTPSATMTTTTPSSRARRRVEPPPNGSATSFAIAEADASRTTTIARRISPPRTAAAARALRRRDQPHEPQDEELAARTAPAGRAARRPP